MELRVLGRGAIAGALAGLLGFVFARLLVEPVINRAIDYESGRDDVLAAIRVALKLPAEADGPEIFSRSFQSSVGIATGLIGIGIAFGLLVAVAWLVLAPRTNVRPRVLAWAVAAFGFAGVFLLPFAKYPANPPAIGHEFSIVERGRLYLMVVVGSVVILALCTLVARSVARRVGWTKALWAAAAVFAVCYGTLFAVLPSLGDLTVNVSASHDFGYARQATETPAPITNISSKPLTVDGHTYAPGRSSIPASTPTTCGPSAGTRSSSSSSCGRPSRWASAGSSSGT